MQNVLHRARCTLSSCPQKVKFASLLQIIRLHEPLLKALISLTLVRLQTQFESSHPTDVNASQCFEPISIRKPQNDTPQPPSGLCSCSQDLLIRFPSCFCIVLSASLDLVNAFSLQHTKSHKNQKRAISMFIKIPSHFSLSLSCNHGNHILPPLNPKGVFFFFIEVFECKV